MRNDKYNLSLSTNRQNMEQIARYLVAVYITGIDKLYRTKIFLLYFEGHRIWQMTKIAQELL